jgi:copper chaperone CopZ
MKALFSLSLIVIYSYQVSAQTIVSAELQAAGLTCSMCSNAIQKALQEIPFVEKVTSDLKSSSFLIQFKDPQNVLIQALRNAVEEAGFSMASLKVKINNERNLLSKTQPVEIGRQFFCITAAEETENKSTIDIIVVDRHFLTEKKWKQFQKLLINSTCAQSPSPKSFMYPAVVIQ